MNVAKVRREARKNSPRSLVPVGAKLAAENRLPYIPLNLENHRAALRFTPELEHEPGIRFGPNRQVKPRRRALRLPPQLHPPVLKNRRPRLRPVQPHADVDFPQQLPARDPARAAHAAGVHRHAEGHLFAGEAAEGGGVEVELGGGGGGVRRGCVGHGGGADGEEGGLGRKVLQLDGAVTRRRRRVDSRPGPFGGLW